jgi:hypothetical protein
MIITIAYFVMEWFRPIVLGIVCVFILLVVLARREEAQFEHGKNGRAVIERIHSVRTTDDTTVLKCSLVGTSEDGIDFRIDRHVERITRSYSGVLKEGDVIAVKIHPQRPLRVKFMGRAEVAPPSS